METLLDKIIECHDSGIEVSFGVESAYLTIQMNTKEPIHALRTHVNSHILRDKPNGKPAEKTVISLIDHGIERIKEKVKLETLNQKING